MRQFQKILIMDTVNLFLNPIWIFYSIGFPVIAALILGFLTSGSYGNTVSSYDYYGVAILFFAISNTAMLSANSFMEERIKSPNLRILYSPVRPFCIHFSKVAATFIFSSVSCTIAAAILRITLNVNYGGYLVWAPFVIMLFSTFFFSALGVLVCCFFKSESIANQVVSPIIGIFCLLGGVFFPVDGFGRAVFTISWFSPVKWMLTACVEIIYDRNFALFLPALGMLAGLSIVAVFLSARLFKGEEYL